MNYRRYTFLLLATVSMLSACAQVKYGVQKGYAFRTISSPGTISTGDDNGNRSKKPMNVKFIAFVETNGSSPVWRRAVINGKNFSTSVQEIKDIPFKVGLSEDDEQPVMIKTKSGNKLWQVLLVPLLERGKQINATGVTLFGTFNSTSISYRIKSIVNLKSPEYY